MAATTRKPENATLVLVRVDAVAPPSACSSSSPPALVGGATPALPLPRRAAAAAASTAAVPAVPATNAAAADTGHECKNNPFPPLSSPSSPQQPRPAPHTLHSFGARPKHLSRSQSSPTISTVAASSPPISNKMRGLQLFGVNRRATDVLAETGKKPAFAVVRRGRMASVEDLAPWQLVDGEERERRERSLERRTVVIKPDPADDSSPPYTREEARRIRHGKRRAEGCACCEEEEKPGTMIPVTVDGVHGSISQRVRAWVNRTSSTSSSVADDQKRRRNGVIEEGIVVDGPAAMTAARKGSLAGHDDDMNPPSPFGVIEWHERRRPSRDSAAVTSGSEADDDYDYEQQDTLSLDHPADITQCTGPAAVVVAEKKHDQQPAPLSPQASTPTTAKSAIRPLKRQSTLESIIQKVPFLHHHHHRRDNSEKSSTTAGSVHPPLVTQLHDNDSSSVPGTIDCSTKPSSACISEDAAADNSNNNKQRASYPLGLQKWFAQPHTRRAQRAAIDSPEEFFDLLWQKYPLLFANLAEVQSYVDCPGPSDKLERLADNSRPQLALNADDALDETEERSAEERRERVRALLHEVHEMWVNGALVDWAKHKGWRLDMDALEWELKKNGGGGNAAGGGGTKAQKKERKDSSQEQHTAEGSHGLKKMIDGVGRKVGGVFTRTRSGLTARVGMGGG
ncbi:uncharacterized protein BKCO1_3500026 [Diplodia corticola]|uniref:Uncharacterized protein n=1 Tax=Diplodia corticola TaxID=236234 RepID=A0A1J9RJS8_9PEZI|nr:uncharacterized protein BKCO1_3500026 [Diplodia corticola]OJD32827.1 hypothetical protein BKCO1_3500026 [Diplodia corticola]